MQYTYLEKQKNGAAVWVGVNDYSDRLLTNAQRQKISNNGVSTDIVRASIVKTHNTRVEQDGDCTTGCVPAGIFGGSTRVELNHVVNVTSALIVAEIRAIADFVEANPRLLQGLQLQTANDYTFPVVGA